MVNLEEETEESIGNNYRIRRSSSSHISSTTTAASTSSFNSSSPNRAFRNEDDEELIGIYNQEINHSEMRRENITLRNEEDELQPSSSTSTTFDGIRARNVNSPLIVSSPDSTFWNGSNYSQSELQSQIVVQDPSCVVSSSTIDDIPSSPFSPVTIPQSQSNQKSNSTADERNITETQSILSNPVAVETTHETSEAKESLNHGKDSFEQNNTFLSLTSSVSNQSGSFHLNNEEFELNSSNISLMRSKIKKASSFERFSAQAQASSSNTSSNNSLNKNSNFNDESISTVAVVQHTDTIPNRPTTSTSSNWTEYGTKTNFVSSFNDGSNIYSTGTKQYHIKKLVARLANTFDIEKLENVTNPSISNEITSSASTTSISTLASTSSDINLNGNSPLLEISNNSETSIHNLQQSTSVSNDSLIRRQLSQSPLNLTENSNAFEASPKLPIPSRNPVISTKTFQNKKIPLTPKQKLLQRMQSGEIVIPISPTPSPVPTQQSIQECLSHEPVHIPQTPPSPSTQDQQHLSLVIHQNQPSSIDEQLLSTIQQQQAHGLMLHDPTSAIVDNEGCSDRYNYDSFMIRSAVGEDFPDGITSKEDSSSAHMLYDPTDAYNYYQYGLPDEIFNSAAAGGNQTTRQSIHPSSILLQSGNGVLNQDDNTFTSIPQRLGSSSHLVEFGLDESIRQNSLAHQNGILHSETPTEELQHVLQLQQQQTILDPNELVSVNSGKGTPQLIEIPTLRNLLMMEPLSNRNSQHLQNQEITSWITTANCSPTNSSNTGDYTNSRILSVNNMRVAIGGGVSSASGTLIPHFPSSTSNSLLTSNSWTTTTTSEWQPARSWQIQSQDKTIEDEVMDMSIMEMDKNILMKRNNQELVSPKELITNPILNTIEIDLSQQSFSNNPHNGSLTGMNVVRCLNDQVTIPSNTSNRNIILENYVEDEDNNEPVNLMSAVNLDGDVELNEVTINQPQEPSIQLTEANYLNVNGEVPTNIVFTTTAPANASAALPNTSAHFNQSPVELKEGNIDEKHIIRVKKKKNDAGILEKKTGNFIPDKPVQPKSFASLPSILTLRRMNGNGWGVLTNRNKKVPANTRFGPVEGPLKRVTKGDVDSPKSVYPFLVMVDSTGVIYQLDRTDDDLCNWMKFVRRASSDKEQNTLVSEEDGLLYFTTCKEIEPKTELQVGYSFEYSQKYNLPYYSTSNSISSDSTPSSPEPKVKKRKPPVQDEFICFECNSNWKTIEELKMHLDKYHEEDATSFRRPKKKAIKKFYEAINKDEIKKVKEDDELTKSDEIIFEDGKKEQEEIVGSSSSDVKIINLKKDAEVEMPTSSITPPKVKCNLCYKSFTTTVRLQKHMLVHSEDHLKPLKCELCGKRFLTNSALAGHIKSHEGKNFECPLCNFNTSQLLHLKEHVQSHKNEENGLFSCPSCSKDFSSYSLVRKHVRAFHGPRLFNCEDCNMKFPTPDKLKLHELKHSTFRAYLCAECGRQFKRKDKLSEHTKKAHGGKSNILEELKPTEPQFLFLRTEKAIPKKVPPRLNQEQIAKYTFRCYDCMIGFRRRGMLVNHLAKKHPDVSPSNIPELSLPITRTAKNYFCPHCERVYKSSSKRKSHILKNHPGKQVPPQVRGKDLKAILEEGVGSTTLDLNVLDGAEMEQIKVTVDQVIRKEAIVGEIKGTPHNCNWCHRQYATRAKLLQHQRKFHIDLMPPEIQIPRPQKNNVKQEYESSIGHVPTTNKNVDGKVNENETKTSSTIHETESSKILLGEIEHDVNDCNDPSSSELEPQSQQENMYGYLITTTGHVTNNELETFLQPEFVMNLLSQRSDLNSNNNSGVTITNGSENVQSSTRTITLCIPSTILSSSQSNSNPINSNPNPSLISTQINFNGTQIITKTD